MKPHCHCMKCEPVCTHGVGAARRAFHIEDIKEKYCECCGNLMVTNGRYCDTCRRNQTSS